MKVKEQSKGRQSYNLAYWDEASGFLVQHEIVRWTRQELIEFSLMDTMVFQGLLDVEPPRTPVLVAWLDDVEQYIGVFCLDYRELPREVLEHIESEAKKLTAAHRKFCQEAH